MEKILALWGLQGSVVPVTDTTWEIGGYILKRYSDPTLMQRNIALLTKLMEQGVPAAAICPTLDGRMFAKKEGDYFLLTEKLKGQSHDFTVKNGMPRKIGEAIGKLHLAFSKMELSDLRENSLLVEMEDWIFDTLQRDRWQLITKEQYLQTTEKLRSLWSKLPIGPIHRDVHPGNFLFDGEELSGYLDFDLSQRNIRIFDLCYYLCGLMIGEEEVSAADWLAAVTEAVRGYETLLPLQEAEYQALPAVMQAIEVLFTAYFLGSGEAALAESAKNLFIFLCKQERNVLSLF